MRRGSVDQIMDGLEDFGRRWSLWFGVVELR